MENSSLRLFLLGMHVTFACSLIVLCSCPQMGSPSCQELSVWASSLCWNPLVWKLCPPIPSLWFGELFFACGLSVTEAMGVWKVHPLAFLQSLYPPIVFIHANQEIFQSTSYVPICHASRQWQNVSFLGCAIQGICRKSQLQIPCHILSPSAQSVIGLSMVCLPLAISVVWSVWSVALWLS